MTRAHIAAVALALLASSCGGEPRTGTRTPPATAAATSAVGATSTPKPTATSAVASWDVDATMEHVRALSVEIGIRHAGSPRDRDAALYIEREVEQLGWDGRLQEFPLPQGGTSWNVIGTPPGVDVSADRYVIVGGHYDSLNGPGANDNATGIGAALEIARRVDEDPGEIAVVFVAFGAEERQPTREVTHHVGSLYYVDQMSERERKNLVAFVNLDMIGVGSTVICGRMSVGPTEGTERCLATARKIGVPARLRVTPDWSDNGSFLREGLNAAWLWTGEDRCCYHNPRDTYDRIRREDLRRSAALGYAIVRSYTR